MNKLALRRAWFQIHKWIGLLLAILIIPISVTGAALVWHDGLDKLINPGRYATTGDAMLPLARYVEAAKASGGAQDRVANVVLPEDGGPVTVTLAPPPPKAAGGGRPARTLVYLDPPTGKVLDVADSRSGVVHTLHVLHGSLMVPGVGRQIVGWIGVVMMISCFTGLWLWWPTVGRWARGLRWRRHNNTDTNLHYLTGFWVAIPLFVLSLTGAWISFPQFFGSLVGEGQRGRGPDRAAMMRARPVEQPAIDIDRAVAMGRALAPDAPLRTVVLPTDRSPDWTLSFATQPLSTVTVADDSGTVARGKTPGNANPVARLMRRIHDGVGMGIVWQTIIFIGGIIPALLAITGIIMWWRARGWRKALADRQRARRQLAPAE